VTLHVGTASPSRLTEARLSTRFDQVPHASGARRPQPASWSRSMHTDPRPQRPTGHHRRPEPARGGRSAGGVGRCVRGLSPPLPSSCRPPPGPLQSPPRRRSCHAPRPAGSAAPERRGAPGAGRGARAGGRAAHLVRVLCTTVVSSLMERPLIVIAYIFASLLAPGQLPWCGTRLGRVGGLHAYRWPRTAARGEPEHTQG